MIDRPLQVKIEDEELVIRIGIDTLAWAFEHQDDNNPYVSTGKDEDGETHDWIRQFEVVDQKEFAKDVIREIVREEEDGSTPLEDFLDKMGNTAADQGSIGIEETKKRQRLIRAGFNTIL